MYGGPRRPNLSPFQGRSRPVVPNFRPRFENPGFPPPRHNVYPSQFGGFCPRQPHSQTQRPFGMNTCPQGPGAGFQPREWQAPGVRQGFRPAGFHDQPRNRGRGGHRGRGSSGIEAYYNHSMVEDPWKELEEKFKNENQQYYDCDASKAKNLFCS